MSISDREESRAWESWVEIRPQTELAWLPFFMEELTEGRKEGRRKERGGEEGGGHHQRGGDVARFVCVRGERTNWRGLYCLKAVDWALSA